MLPKKFRLNLKKERFLKVDKQLSGTLFKVVLKERQNGPKVGFIVSGKVGKAASRNRVKRMLSEAVAKKLNKIPNDLCLIFIAFPRSAQATYEEINTNLDKILAKLTNS